MKLRHLPNIITVIRILCVIPFVHFLIDERYQAAFVVFFICGASDGVDGLLARRFGWTSRVGALLDPLADKLLMMCSFSALAYLNLIPLWFFIIVILRDIIIISGVGGVLYIHGTVEMEPSLLSKWNTALQIFFICMVVFELAFQPLPELLFETVMYAVTITTLCSLAGYFIEGVRQAFCSHKPKHG